MKNQAVVDITPLQGGSASCGDQEKGEKPGRRLLNRKKKETRLRSNEEGPEKCRSMADR